MRVVGETNFSLMGKAKKGAPKSLKVKTTKLVCESCGAVYFENELNLRRYPRNAKSCTACRVGEIAKDKHEMNLAIIAVAKRKGLI